MATNSIEKKTNTRMRAKSNAPKKDTSIKKFEGREIEDDSPNFYVCCRCRDKFDKLKDNFSGSQSELFAGWDYHIPFCKNCVTEIYNHYLEEYNSEERAIERVCQLFDMYYNEQILEIARSAKKENSLILAYISKCNLHQYNGKTYDTTLDEELKNVITSLDDIKDKGKVKAKTIKFFGAGLKDENDYKFLQEEYDDWTSRYECKTKAQEEIFKSIAFKQLELLKARRSGTDTKDLEDSFQKWLGTAKIQPKQNASDSISDTQTLGTLLQKWEETEPLPEIDEELRDVDKIGLYIDVFFRGHLAKMMGIKNGLSNLYTKFMKKYTVNKPEYEGDESNEALFDAIFGSDSNMEDDG